MCTARWWPARMPPTQGEAKNSWLTGTAAWSFINVSQYLLGIVPTMDGLRIDPCLPGSLGRFHAERRYRGAVYQITVRQPAGVEHGVAHITCDGVPVSGTVLPIAEPGRTDEVIVEMGE